MNSSTAPRVALGMILCVFCSCVTPRWTSSDSVRYVLTVNYISPIQKTTNTIEITARPAVPFAVKTQDQAGNQYRVNGSLRRKTDHSVHLEQLEIGVHLEDGSFKESSSEGGADRELGQAWGWGSVDGILLYETSIRITKK